MNVKFTDAVEDGQGMQAFFGITRERADQLLEACAKECTNWQTKNMMNYVLAATSRYEQQENTAPLVAAAFQAAYDVAETPAEKAFMMFRMGMSFEDFTTKMEYVAETRMSPSEAMMFIFRQSNVYKEQQRRAAADNPLAELLNMLGGPTPSGPRGAGPGMSLLDMLERMGEGAPVRSPRGGSWDERLAEIQRKNNEARKKAGAAPDGPLVPTMPAGADPAGGKD